jgi:hypothetical protein
MRPNEEVPAELEPDVILRQVHAGIKRGCELAGSE